jgi:hypothetical protein
MKTPHVLWEEKADQTLFCSELGPSRKFGRGFKNHKASRPSVGSTGLSV